LPISRRTGSGYRSYGAEAVRAGRFVNRAQLLGFIRTEVKTLLEQAAGDGPLVCALDTRQVGADPS
jgi:DNA-binding transcriptional MerR regulator